MKRTQAWMGIRLEGRWKSGLKRRPLRSAAAAGVRVALALSLLLLTHCGDSSRAPEPMAKAAPTTRVYAAVVLEPLKLKIGEVVSAQITVVTPPDYRLLPVQPPAVAGAWLLDATSLEVARSPTRWVHRTQVRLRTSDVGPLVWPAFNVVVEDADGTKQSVEVSERAFEVVSTLSEHPDQVTPFGLRTPEAGSGGGGFWLGVGSGAAAAIALAALLAFFALRESVPAKSEAAKRKARERELTLWDWADNELSQAIDALDSPEGPREGATRGARLLRQYVARRFNVETESLTTEELSATKPPLAIDSRWPELLRILHRFDAERFRQSQVDESATSRIHSEIDAVKRFVDDSTPPELRR